jgi:anti-sigma B factor antagonist
MQSQPFELRIDEGADTTLISLAGELDLASAPHLGQAFETLREGGAGHVTIDLRDLTFLDSTGVRAFLEADLAGRNGQAGVSFIAGPRIVMKVLQLAGVMERLDWVEAEAAAGRGPGS